MKNDAACPGLDLRVLLSVGLRPFAETGVMESGA